MFLYKTQFGSDPDRHHHAGHQGGGAEAFENAGNTLTAADIDMITDVPSEMNITEGLQLIWRLRRTRKRYR